MITKNSIIKEIGYFPVLNAKYSSDFPEGKIVLKHGEHKGANRGFGYIHILAEHSSDLTNNKLSHDEEGVAEYIGLIVQFGAKIYCEFNQVRGNHRPMIVRSRYGTVILELLNIDEVAIYSVITAYGSSRSRGIQIGSIPRTKAPD